MQTYSHLIITAALKRKYEDTSLSKYETGALLLGSVMPDMPLVGLSALFLAQKFWLGDGNPSEGLFGAAYDQLYFNDPVWLAGHAAFHAPPMLLLYLTLGYWFGVRGGRRWGRCLFWFAVGCGLHSAIDIVTHHHDGPLLLFPFDWQTRFRSPVSYWDPEHYGGIFAPLEHVLNVVLLVWLVLSRRGGNQHND